MRKAVRAGVSLALGAALVTGIAACDQLPDIDPSRLPDISIPSLPSGEPEPQPTETVTEDPGPSPTETVTEAPEPEKTSEPEPSPTPTATADAAEASEEGVTWWPWLLLAIPLLGLLIWWWVVAAKRRAWNRRLEAAATELSWFEDSLVPQILGKTSGAEAASTWQAAKPRIIDLDRRLHELEEDAPSDARSARAAHGLAATRGLVAAIDEETSTQPGVDADQLRARRAAVDAARTQARSWVAAVRR